MRHKEDLERETQLGIQILFEKRICEQTHNIYVNTIKQQNIHAYKYDYLSIWNTHVSGSTTVTTPKSLIESSLAQS
jgi:hypothetical protein